MNQMDILKKLNSAGLLSEREVNLGYIDSGSYALNKVISGKYNGGWPIGHISEIMGDSSTGKTLFLTHAFAAAQKNGWFTAMYDNEFSYNAPFAKSMGVDPAKLIYDDPETVPECFSRMEILIEEIRKHDKDTPIVIGLDSMAGQSDKESEKKISEFDNMDGAVRAKEIGQCLRHINPILRKNKVALLVINQIRAKPGVMYGDPTTRSGGGKSLEFYCGVCVRTQSNKTSDVLRDDKDNPLGIKGKIKNTKNKVTTPFQECDFELYFNKGLSRFYGLETVVLESGLIEKSGAWYTEKSTGNKFQGEEKLMSYIQSSQGVKDFLENN